MAIPRLPSWRHVMIGSSEAMNSSQVLCLRSDRTSLAFYAVAFSLKSRERLCYQSPRTSDVLGLWIMIHDSARIVQAGAHARARANKHPVCSTAIKQWPAQETLWPASRNRRKNCNSPVASDLAGAQKRSGKVGLISAHLEV
jgi:hypothetical protein